MKRDVFRRIAQAAARGLGTPAAFLSALLVIVVWASVGSVFHYSDTWQLFINTGTTIVTFLMVFLIQNTQNRDATVMHLKLDELIRAVKEARTGLVDMEDFSEEQIEALRRQFARLRARHEARPEGAASGDPPAEPATERETPPAGGGLPRVRPPSGSEE